MKNAGILTIGNEILQGYTLDTNTNHISKELTFRNIETTVQLTIADNKEKIIEKVDKFLIKNYDYIFITGGLGPTHDDITRESLKELFNCKLSFLEDRHKIINKRFKNTKIPNNQSQILDIANPLENKYGTAIGMYFKYKNSNIIVLPGVPVEMKGMLNLYFDLHRKDFKKNNSIFTLNTCGIYETKLFEKMKPLISKYRKKIYFSFLPSYSGVKLRVNIKNNSIDRKKIENELVHYLKEHVYGIDDVSIEQIIFNNLKKTKKTISLAESCTGGSISKKITSIPGVSNVFAGSVIAYSNDIKTKILNVDSKLINNHGAVSKEVAKEMAFNIKKIFQTDIGVSCTGISGPGGGSKNKPVGTVFVSVCYKKIFVTEKFFFNVDRQSHRKLTEHVALYMLWRLLIKIK